MFGVYLSERPRSLILSIILKVDTPSCRALFGPPRCNYLEFESILGNFRKPESKYRTTPRDHDSAVAKFRAIWSTVLYWRSCLHRKLPPERNKRGVRWFSPSCDGTAFLLSKLELRRENTCSDAARLHKVLCIFRDKTWSLRRASAVANNVIQIGCRTKLRRGPQNLDGLNFVAGLVAFHGVYLCK